MNERPIPAAALHDVDAVEMLRVWIADQGLHCSIKVGMYKETMNIPEERAWGIILADITRHVSNALAEGYGANKLELIDKIKDSYLRELGSPSSSAKGEFVQE